MERIITPSLIERRRRILRPDISRLGPVCVCGVGGDSICNMLWRVQHGLFTDVQVQEVVLLAGTNDVLYGTKADDVAAGAAALLRSVLREAVGGGLRRVALLAIPPLLPKLQGTDVDVRPYNAALERVVATIAQANALDPALRHLVVEFVDIHRLLCNASGGQNTQMFLDDGVSQLPHSFFFLHIIDVLTKLLRHVRSNRVFFSINYIHIFIVCACVRFYMSFYFIF